MLRVALLLAVVLSGCSSSGKLITPFAQDVPLPTGTPEAARLDTFVLNSMDRQIAAQDEHKLYSIVLVRDGRVVFERYYNGRTRDTPHDIRSATKSITSLLTGIAIAEGAVPDVDASLLDYLGAAYPAVQGKGDLTLRHLLTMRTGLDCDDGDRRTRGQEDRMYRRKDWVGYFLALDRTAPGGSVRSRARK